MLRMLLYPPNNAMAFFPAAYQQPSAAEASNNATVAIVTSLSIRNSSISTLCQTVAEYTAFLSASSPTSMEVGPHHIKGPLQKMGAFSNWRVHDMPHV